MKKKTRKDSAPMAAGDFSKALEEFVARRASRVAEKPTPETENGDEGDENIPETSTPAVGNTDDDDIATPENPVPGVETGDTDITEQLKAIEERRDRRDSMGDPASIDTAKGMYAECDGDLDAVLHLLKKVLAKLDFIHSEQMEAHETAVDGDDCTTPGMETSNGDEDDDPAPVAPAIAEGMTESAAQKMNADSIDNIVKSRISILRAGDRLNLDGLDSMSMRDAKVAIIKKMNPNMRLDGKDRVYIDAAYDMAIAKLNSSEFTGTNRQRRQMFNADSVTASSRRAAVSGASARREAMIKRHRKED